MHIKTKKKFKLFLKVVWKIVLAASGAAAAYSNPITAGIAGTSAIASAISSAVKDKNLKKMGKVINLIACNIDNAENDRIINEKNYSRSKFT